jgi:lysophospholipase L1-like esterase
LPDSKVYWIHIGTNDFCLTECSEEAVLLGILRLAEEIHETSPGSVIVINSILPRAPGSTQPDFYGPIQEVNQQLEAFCVNHEHLVYFDATPLFVNNPVLKKKNKSGDNTLRAGMFQADGFHLTLQGYKTWGNAILDRLKLIIYEDDESSY